MLVEGWLARAARTRPGHGALETTGGHLSYAQLDTRARAAAGELAARGAGAGARVALALPTGLDFAVALHACLLLGAVAVPIDLRLGSAEQAPMLDGCDVLVGEPPAAGSARPERAAQGARPGAEVVHEL